MKRGFFFLLSLFILTACQLGLFKREPVTIRWNWDQGHLQLVIPPKISLEVLIEFNSEWEQSVSLPNMEYDKKADPDALTARDVFSSLKNQQLYRRVLTNNTRRDAQVFIEPLYRETRNDSQLPWKTHTRYHVAKTEADALRFGFEIEKNTDYKDLIITIRIHRDEKKPE